MRSIISASSPNGRRLCGRPASRIGVEYVDRVLGLDGDLEAEVAGVAGARQGDRCRADLGLGLPEERQRRRPRVPAHSARRGSADPGSRGCRSRRRRPRSSTRSRPRRSLNQPKLGRAAVSRKSVSECRKTTPSSMTKPRSSHHSGVLRLAGPAAADVAGQHARRGSRSASGPWMRYLNRGEVSKTPTALRTAKYSCFGRVRVAQRGQVPLPVRVEALGVELAQPGVERGGLDHLNDTLLIRASVAVSTDSTSRSVGIDQAKAVEDPGVDLGLVAEVADSGRTGRRGRRRRSRRGTGSAATTPGRSRAAPPPTWPARCTITRGSCSAPVTSRSGRTPAGGRLSYGE